MNERLLIKTGTEQDLTRLEVLRYDLIDVFYFRSVILALSFLTAGFLLDVLYGLEIFQRFGALVVGYAILVSFRVSQYSEGIGLSQTVLESLNDAGKQVPHSHEAGKDAALIEKWAPRLKVSNDLDDETALVVSAMVLKLARVSKNRVRTWTEQARKLRRKEVVLAVFGTVIWAFGDWLTNYAVHCGRLICSSV